MSDTFDWAGLWQGAEAAKHDCMFCDCDAPNEAAAAYLRTRIEAAFVPVEDVTAERGRMVDRIEEWERQIAEATARAEAAEAENARLREPLREALEHWDYCRAENRDPRFVPECWTKPTRQALGAEHGK